MRKKIIIVSTLLLLILAVAGNTFAWYTASDNNYSDNLFRNGDKRIGLSVIDISTLQTDRSIEVQNKGNAKTYVRVRLIPQWNDPSIPISNVQLNLDLGEGWTRLQGDGYYYYKNSISDTQKTSTISYNPKIVNNEYQVTLNDFTLKVVSEGVQTNKQAIKSVWGIDFIPSN
nr:hypothetical protein [Tissierella sp.]